MSPFSSPSVPRARAQGARVPRALGVALAVIALAAACASDDAGSAGTTAAVGQVELTPDTGGLTEFENPEPSDVAVTIDGRDFTFAEVSEINPDYAFGSARATFELDFFVRQQLIGGLLDEYDRREFTPADEELRAQLQVAGIMGEDAAENDQLTDEIRLAFTLAGVEPMNVDQARARYDADPAAFSLTCTSHILHDTEADALETMDLLDAGGEFGQLAAERSTGPSAPRGGDLGCNPPGTMVAEFAAAEDSAEIGAFVGPVQTSFGFHVLVVTERQLTPFEESVADIQQQQLQADFEPAVTALFAELADHTVEIDPRAGVWSATAFQVLPPGTPAEDPFATLPTPTSVGG
ncbi:MAG: hypothetical protein HKN26_02875 [Acidimicrobiales bacterium]|nr:hypothetical protein [Acidimicrobiales bacterium]